MDGRYLSPPPGFPSATLVYTNLPSIPTFSANWTGETYHRHPVSRPPRLYTPISRPSLPFPQNGRETPLSNNSIASVQGKFVSGRLVLIALPSRAPSPPPPPAGGSSLLFSARRWRCSRSGGRRSGRALSESPDPDKALPCGPCHSAVPAA